MQDILCFAAAPDDAERFLRIYYKFGAMISKEAAQAACNLLYDSGVKVMWSFSSGPLYKPLDAVVQYENLALSLAHLKMQALDLPERRDG